MSTNEIISSTLSSVTIFSGGYGSGKSEIAVNYALAANSKVEHIAIADLDIVNPYFRSREARAVLEAAGVEVVAPLGKVSNSALPALPADIYRVLINTDIYAIIDVGGDDVGAKVLGRYQEHIPENKNMFLVVNPARPFQNTAEKIQELAIKIMHNSRQKIDAIINNSNLVYDTTISFMEETFPIVQKAADLLNVPIAFTAIDKNLVKTNEYPNINTEFFHLDLQLSPKWRRK